ncbi:MAG: ComEA family DNA-binding protein [Nitrospirales bacterium]
MPVISIVSRVFILSVFCASLLFGTTMGFAGPMALNLNNATAAQLEALPGIGPELAERIMDYKKENGDFKNIQDLAKVKGIGEKKLAKLKDSVMVKKTTKKR